MTEARAGVTREVREFKPQDLEHRSFTLCIVAKTKRVLLQSFVEFVYYRISVKLIFLAPNCERHWFVIWIRVLA